ncbi:SusC/RagA family TonB-linked outer membrane protein [Croceivirga thetidis]|uniref:TonB-dependent receptor n=1 Tax=Croceivirga thetidis TaxID=2721623 RepID=A0ABX1GNT0_9FLAO|nr:TonB-dependent receptor [Croceivirga thetidis]NKI30746.1 TonB-dependent receptor [Croceivirga thetidis]
MMSHFLKRCGVILAFFISANSVAQTISGKVSDDTGPLPGASIVEKGTTNGTQTDFDGNFVLDLSNSNATLVVSYIGYSSQEITLNGNTQFNIILETDSQSLDEVVIIGYGQTQNKRTVSQAVNTISSNRIAALPVARPESALQGTAPGIVVVQNSGAPGSPLTIRLRGTATPGNSQPLFLVDGIQVPNIDFVNPSDIQSISTLKDAAASAIYGARAANGVVLVETKKGRRNTDKITVSIDGYTGFQDRVNTPDLMNTSQYVEYYNQYQTRVGGNTIAAADIPRLPNTNWYDVLYDNSSPKSFLNASVQGGGEKSNFLVSGSIFDQQGLIGGDAGKSGFERKTLNLNFGTEVVKNVNLNIGANLIRNTRQRLPGENDDTVGAGNPFNQLASLLPLFPVLDDAGNPFDVSAQNGPADVNGIAIPKINGPFNPIIPIEYSTIEDISDIKLFNIGASWNIMSDLTFNLGASYFENLTNTKSFQEAFDFRGDTVPNGVASLGTGTNQLDETQSNSRWSQIDATLTHKFDGLPDAHNLEMIVGTSFYERKFETFSRQAQGLLVNNFGDANFAQVGDQTNIITPFPDFSTKERLIAYFGRALYNYKEKYLFSASLRADASSKFGPGNRTGYFPSLSAGWVLSEEDWFGNNLFDLFKIRGSWGISGVDNIADDQYRATFSANSGSVISNQFIVGLNQNVLPNQDIKWEETTQANIGLDANLLNNSLGITLDYYTNTTNDILLNVGGSTAIGIPLAAQNVGEVKNSGFEALISYRKKYGSGFGWNANFNIAFNDNEVKDLGGLSALTSGTTLVFASPVSATSEGESIASFFGFKSNGVDSDGELIFEDLNGDGTINADDRQIIGNPLPDFTYGFNFGANYKGFDFSTFFYGSQGNDIFDATVRNDFAFSNRPASYLNNGIINVLGNVNESATLGEVSDFYVKDGSFLRLRTITLGYSIPDKFISNIGLSRARFYLTGENLFVITDYDGADPEIGQQNAANSLDIGIDRGFYPAPKTILFGFQLQF